MLGSVIAVNFLINYFYGTEQLGIYVLCYSIAQVGILGIGGVFSPLIRRDLSINLFDPDNYLTKVQLLRFSNLLFVVLLSIISVGIFFQSLKSILLLILLTICAKGFDVLSESYYTAYQTLDRIADYSILKILNAAAFILVSWFFCIYQFEIVYLYLGLFGSAVFIFAANLFYWNHIKSFFPPGAENNLQNASFRFLAVESLPLMINFLVFQLGLRFGNILIFDKIGEKNLGIYSLVFITIGMFTGVANAFALVFFGRLSKIFVEQPQIFFKRLHQIILLFLIVGIIFYILYLIFAPVISYLFGLNIDPQLIKIMSLAIPFMFIVGCLGNVFTIIKKQTFGLYLSLAALIVNLTVYYVLLEKFGLLGAGYAFLFTSVFHSLIIYFGVLFILKFNMQKENNISNV